MNTTLDYESIETYLGDRLRRHNNLDIHSDAFFPVTLLDRLFHYSEDARGVEQDEMNRPVHRNFHGHDFDRWIDNIIAHTVLPVIDNNGNRLTIELIDIDSISFEPDGSVAVTMPGEEVYELLEDLQGGSLRATSLDDLSIEIDLSKMFDHAPVDSDSEPYLGFGTLAHIVRVVCDKSGIDAAKADPIELSNKLFNHFKNEMLPLIPSLWNDMEHIMHYARPALHGK